MKKNDSLYPGISSAAVHADLGIRKSRFIALAVSAGGREAVQFVLSSPRSEHLALHICWAFLASGRSGFADDDEPYDTGGRPIMEVLHYYKLNNVLGMAGRYFGGLKLREGGLVHAYTDAIARALKKRAEH